jgi:hypothetical protein
VKQKETGILLRIIAKKYSSLLSVSFTSFIRTHHLAYFSFVCFLAKKTISQNMVFGKQAVYLAKY